jgi:glycosyltransferase involved in cell wall biosynthesis
MSARFKIAAYVYPHGLINPTGVGMLTLHMTLELARNPDVELKLLVSADEVGSGEMLPAGHPLHGIPAIGLPGSYKVREACWLACQQPALDRYLGPDWWIYNSMETFTPARHCRRIVTVHHLESPSARPWYSCAGLRQRLADFRLHKAVTTADVLVAQSTFTARETAFRHGVPESSITVVGSGVDDELLTTSPGEVPLAAREYGAYLISPGAFQLRKGTDYLFALARELHRRGSPLKIVCPFGLRGLRLFTDEVRSLPNVVALDYISRAALLDLVRGAVAMVVPSRLEGFGLTVIESMALGTPVIASNNSALPETLGGAGVLVDPTDAVALADAAEAIHKQSTHRAELVRLGRQRATHFTWQKCMERLLAGVSRWQTEHRSS